MNWIILLILSVAHLPSCNVVKWMHQHSPVPLMDLEILQRHSISEWCWCYYSVSIWLYHYITINLCYYAVCAGKLWKGHVLNSSCEEL